MHRYRTHQVFMKTKRLYLLDGMALAYRAHFALIKRPIRTSAGVNTSALFGFTQTMLEILQNRGPTHIAVAFDTDVPTHRHREYPEYKAQREAMPEELRHALPAIRRLIEGFNIPVLTCDSYEADDIIGTLTRRAEAEEFETYMVTPDKDFSQLVSAQTFLMRPGRMGDQVEILSLGDILTQWQVQRPEQVTDVLGLWGDTSDNIPGVPGIGEKTAKKLIAEFGSLENLLAHTDRLKGKQRERLEENSDQARLSKRLATIVRNAPLEVSWDSLQYRNFNAEALRPIFVEYEFNALGKRVFGEEFQAGRGYRGEGSGKTGTRGNSNSAVALRTIQDAGPDYRLVDSPAGVSELADLLNQRNAFAFDTETDGLDPKEAVLLGLSFCWESGRACYMALPREEAKRKEFLQILQSPLTNPKILKIAHNLKFDLSVLQWHGVEVTPPFFDTMIAHSLMEPEVRHGMDYLSERFLGYTPVPITALIGKAKSEQITLAEVAADQVAEYSAEDADVTWQLKRVLQDRLEEYGAMKVFHEIECPLTPVLADMEFTGVHIDTAALAQISHTLAQHLDQLRREVHEQAGCEFNLNSPKQLGEVLFDRLKLGGDRPRRTKTGQYATHESVLQAMAQNHPIVQSILEFREAAKLKSTYVDALPAAVCRKTGRVHTTFHQVVTSTGRLNSQNPNLQNIPIRSPQGREIRKAFVARGKGYRIMSADYSQIELRIIAALSGDAAMQADFAAGHDIHAATAARVYGVDLDLVSTEMRRNAKSVNFGIAYGISAFGLAQRIGISRLEAAEIIKAYFRQYPAVQVYIDKTIAFARENGYVQSLSGRRRYLPDIRSANATIRSAAERNAINMPIQGTAADMIKLAMIHIHAEFGRRRLQSHMILQVHDELIFDLWIPEEKEVVELVRNSMQNALPLSVPIEVEVGVGDNWLEAH